MKLFATLAVSLALSLVGCGGKSGGGAGTGPAAKTCADVGTNMSTQMRAQMPDAPENVMNMVVDAGVSACNEDGWSAETITCFATATGESSGCETGLTQEQKDSLSQRIASVLDSAAGEGGVEGGMEGDDGDGGDNGEE